MQDHDDSTSAREARDWIVRLNSGQVSEDELRRFKAWRDASDQNRRAFARERAFWQQLGDPAPAPARAIGRRRLLLGGGALAAAAAGAVALPPLALAMRADLRTGVGEMAEHVLPDGSRAALNTDSALGLDFAPGRRAVALLRGEVEFTVRPGPPFRVAAAGGWAQAEEGRFLVQLDRDRARVSSFQGALSVMPGGAGAPLVLAPGQQARYGGGAPLTAPQVIDPDLALAWRKGRIIFEASPLGDAMRELGRYIPERVMLAPHVDALAQVSGIFSTHEARAAIDALARTQGLSALRLPGLAILLT